MFGHQDDQKDDDTSSESENVITPDKPADEIVATDTADAGTTGEAAPADKPAPVIGTDTAGTADETTVPGTAPVTDDAKPDDTQAASEDDNAWQHPGAPLEDKDDTKEEEPEEDTPEKGPAPIKDIVGSSAGPDFKPFPQPSTDYHGGGQPDNTPHELIEVKQKALNDLAPLVSQLDQSPEDKFRTIMMMIQASDDQNLVQSAYEAAHDIKDEKVRAQALLDVVNEINYFTQHPEN